jgi:hypothetical protein
MAFAQLTFRDGLRDIETCLRALGPKLYHAGFHGDISRSTLADANEIRDWRIHAELAQILITRARRLYAQDDFGVALKNTVYAFDSSTIDLCLALFPWALFRQHKAAVKLHTLIDLGCVRIMGVNSLSIWVHCWSANKTLNSGGTYTHEIHAPTH